MKRMAGRPAAIALLVICLGLMTASIWIRVTTMSVQSFLDTATLFPWPLLGALVAFKKPEQPIGWLMLMIATGLAGASFSDAIVQLDGISETTAGTAQMFNHVSFAVMVGLFGLLLALFPTGRVGSPRWRVLRWSSLSALVLIAASGVLGPSDDAEPQSPLAIEVAGSVLELVGATGLVLGFLSIVLGGISVVVRFRSGNPTERDQIRWFAFGIGALVTLMLVSLLPMGRGPVLDAVFEVVLVVMSGLVLPGCIALGVLKHRLYDIDVVINRTLVYGSLTAILGGSYLLIVVLLQLLLESLTRESDLAVAGSTLAVAALFRPALGLVQRLIDRRFYRRKYDAAEALREFTGRLREQVDLDSLEREIVGAVSETMQPAHASVWLMNVGSAR